MSTQGDLDKGGVKVHFDNGTMTADALIAAKNTASQLLVNAPGQTPERVKTFDFAGFTVPDNTDYPDTIAPIGSTFTHFKVTAGVVVGAARYMKTSAATWTVIGAVAAA